MMTVMMTVIMTDLYSNCKKLAETTAAHQINIVSE